LRTRDKISEIISSGRDESMACMDGRKMVCHSKRGEGINKGFELALYHCGLKTVGCDCHPGRATESSLFPV
jgi:hypothetical protein